MNLVQCFFECSDIHLSTHQYSRIIGTNLVNKMSAIGFVKAIHSVESRQWGVAKGGSNNAGLSVFKVYV